MSFATNQVVAPQPLTRAPQMLMAAPGLPNKYSSGLRSSTYLQAMPSQRSYQLNSRPNSYLGLFKQSARAPQLQGRSRPLMMSKSLFDPQPEDKNKKNDITARFDWMGKTKEEREEESYEMKQPDAKPEMPSELKFVFRDYFYEVVKIDIGEGYKIMRENIKPSWRDAQCALSVVKVPLPCGMVLANVEKEEGRGVKGVIEVIDLIEGGNAEKAGIKVGDAIRGCNAVA